MTSAAGRIITTWPGHCFPPAGSVAERGRGGGLPGSPPPPTPRLGEGRVGPASPSEGESERNHHPGPQFLSFATEGSPFQVPS